MEYDSSGLKVIDMSGPGNKKEWCTRTVIGTRYERKVRSNTQMSLSLAVECLR